MKLRDKFKEFTKQESWEKENYNAIECEEIAGEFAIRFANWYDFMLKQNDNLNERFTARELLEMFKKEKGL
jgi:hypothetical protein